MEEENLKPDYLCVTSLGTYAFYGCTGLTSVTIGSGVTSIGSSAFENCNGLNTVTFVGSGTITFGSYSFVNNPATTDLRTKYNATGAGTYTRNANTWTKS